MKSLLPLLATPDRGRSIRVFVSSTFQDMSAEREVLVKRVFPDLRAYCSERGIVWAEVDLRWGIPQSDVLAGRVLSVCLAEIDRCRPFFIGLLGDRYGSVARDLLPQMVREVEWVHAYADRSVIAAPGEP